MLVGTRYPTQKRSGSNDTNSPLFGVRYKKTPWLQTRFAMCGTETLQPLAEVPAKKGITGETNRLLSLFLTPILYLKIGLAGAQIKNRIGSDDC